MKKVLLAIAVVAVASMAVQAGELKLYEWPTGGYIPQEITTIPVKMDIGYWVRVKDQDKKEIKLNQISIHEYEGCVDLVFECNLNINLSAEVAEVGPDVGDFSISKLEPNHVESPGGTVTVCVKLKKADLSKYPGGTKNAHVATVTIKVVPQA